jgi:hypothetical protein
MEMSPTPAAAYTTVSRAQNAAVARSERPRMSSVSSPRACRAAVRGKSTVKIVAGRKNATRANAEAAAYAPASSAEKRLDDQDVDVREWAMPTI